MDEAGRRNRTRRPAAYQMELFRWLDAEQEWHDSTLFPFDATRFFGRFVDRLSNDTTVVANANYQIKDQDQNGVPTFVAGDIGTLGAGTPDKAAKDFLKAQKHLLHQTGNEDFDATQVTKDSLGQKMSFAAYELSGPNVTSTPRQSPLVPGSPR